MAITISDVSPRIQYTATSGQTSFSVPFEFFADSDLVVEKTAIATGLVTTLTLAANPSTALQYSVSGAGVTGGGSITLGGGATINDKYTITRNLPISRSTDFATTGTFPIESLNTELDKIIAMMQQQSVDINLSPRASSTTSTAFGLTFPELVANKILSVNSSGDGLLFSQEIGNYKGNWGTATPYVQRDLVKDTSNGNIYIINTAHTSSGSQPLSSNANSSYYDLIVDAASATSSASAAASSATAAASSATASASSATDAQTAQTAAELAETNAETAQTAAETARTGAETAETNAGISETNAASSASTASTQATNSANSASASATSASASATSATASANSATAAATSESNASTSASTATTQASNASTSASAAATSATNASNAQTAAETAQSAAETAQAAAEAAADNFDDTYLGAKASDPTVDNDGDALTAGDLYFNTTSNVLKYYDGSTWNSIEAVDTSGFATKGFATAMSIAL